MKKFIGFDEWLNEMAKDYSGETFTFLSRRYSVEKAMQLIRKNPEKYIAPDGTYWEIPIDSLKGLMADGIALEKEDGKKYYRIGVNINPQYASKISEEDLAEPGILVKDGDFDMLIDGWHRAYRKMKEGEKSFNVYIIDDEEDLDYIKSY